MPPMSIPLWTVDEYPRTTFPWDGQRHWLTGPDTTVLAGGTGFVAGFGDAFVTVVPLDAGGEVLLEELVLDDELGGVVGREAVAGGGSASRSCRR